MRVSSALLLLGWENTLENIPRSLLWTKSMLDLLLTFCVTGLRYLHAQIFLIVIPSQVVFGLPSESL